jgi:hypothetical protein
MPGAPARVIPGGLFVGPTSGLATDARTQESFDMPSTYVRSTLGTILLIPKFYM